MEGKAEMRDSKKRSKFQRWVAAVKAPSQLTIMSNQLAWTFGMTIGFIGAVIMLIMSKQWIWAFVVFCGTMINVWQVVALRQNIQMLVKQKKIIKETLAEMELAKKDGVAGNSIPLDNDPIWKEIEEANKQNEIKQT